MPIVQPVTVDFPAIGKSISEAVDDATSWIWDLARNSLTGKLTPEQIATIKAETAEQIRQAAGDNFDLAGQEIAQANQEIDKIVTVNNIEADKANPLSTMNLGKAAGVVLLVIVAGVMTFAAVAAFRST